MRIKYKAYNSETNSYETVERYLTPEEESEHNLAMSMLSQQPEPTTEERLDALESALLDIIMGGAK